MALGDGVIWNEAIPDNNSLAHEIDDYDRDLRLGVRSRMAIEHIWPAAQTGTAQGGFHKYISMQPLATAPTLVAASNQVGALYIGTSADGYPLVHLNSAGSTFTIHNSTADGSILVPKGIIVIWSGSIATIPDGWLLCDGTSGTPDLRNFFVIGAGDTYDPDDTGGEATHILTEAELPAHTHNIESVAAADLSGGAYTINRSGGATAQATGSTGSGDAHENLPPYWALAYIMKS